MATVWGNGNFREPSLYYRDWLKATQNLARVMRGWEVADALAVGVELIVDQARRNAIDQGLYKSGELVASIQVRKVNQYRVDIIVRVIYGAAHEFGLEKQKITERQRRFFWAMWAQTEDEMWKALALSDTYTIPARPYLRPAIDSRKTEAIRMSARALSEIMRAAVP